VMLKDEQWEVLLSVVDPNRDRIPLGQGSNRKVKWHKNTKKRRAENSLNGREVFLNHVLYSMYVAG
jgi:hypothetical protein